MCTSVCAYSNFGDCKSVPVYLWNIIFNILIFPRKRWCFRFSVLPSNKKVNFHTSQTAVFWVNSKRSLSCCLPGAGDWHPGQPLPLRVQWGSDTCVAWTLRAPSVLHIHQPVSLSAGQFIINSCWLVKSGPGRGTHTYIYIHCEDPLAMDGFQRPWTHPLSLNDGHSPESSNIYVVKLLSPSHQLPHPSLSSLSLSLSHSVSLHLFFLFTLLLSTFCHHVRNKSSPSGLWGGGVKMKSGCGWPFAMCLSCLFSWSWNVNIDRGRSRLW